MLLPGKNNYTCKLMMALEQLTLHIIYIYTYVYILHIFIVVLLHKQQILPVESAIACSELSLENHGNLFIYIYIINNSMIAGHCHIIMSIITIKHGHGLTDPFPAVVSSRNIHD